MISIVALYSLIRRENSARRSCSRRSRSAPTGAGDAGGATPLRAARAASFGSFACARALASASVIGPTSAAGFLVELFRCFLIPRAICFAFPRLPEAAMASPFSLHEDNVSNDESVQMTRLPTYLIERRVRRSVLLYVSAPSRLNPVVQEVGFSR